MSREVPEGWELRRLADLAHESRNSFVIGPFGSDLTVKDYRDEGVPVIFVRDVQSYGLRWKSEVYVSPEKAEKLQAHSARPGDIVITKMGLPPGIAAEIPPSFENGIVTADIVRLRPNTEITDSAFLALALNGEHIREAVAEITGGQTRPKITLRDYKAIALALPPLDEQRRIAEILSSVDEAIAATRAVIEQTRKVKQGVLERLLTKGIGHTRFKQTEIGEIPEGWVIAEVQEHFHVQLGKMLSKAAKVGSSPSPYLRNANVQWGRIDTKDLLHMDFSEQEKQKFRLQCGDLLVCEGGDVGRCAIWNGGQEMYYQKALHRLREKTGAVKNQYLMYVLVRIFTSKALSAGLVGTNSIAHFTREQFLRLKFPVPGTEEQNAICETLEALDASINENNSKQEALLSLRSALISDLLTGRKRVNDALPMAAE